VFLIILDILHGSNIDINHLFEHTNVILINIFLLGNFAERSITTSLERLNRVKVFILIGLIRTLNLGGCSVHMLHPF